MFAIVERVEDLSGKERETGTLVAGEWGHGRELPTPKVGAGYRIEELGSRGYTILSTGDVVEVLANYADEVRFKTRNAEYRVFLSTEKPETLYNLGDVPNKV